MSNNGKRNPWLGVRDMLAFPAGVVVVGLTLAILATGTPLILVAARWAWGLL